MYDFDLDDLRARADAQGTVTGEIVVSFDEILDPPPHGFDRDGLYDTISYELTGTWMLTDIHYKPTGVTSDGRIILSVHGNISDILDDHERLRLEFGQD